jgi:hypothetical protein
MTKRYRSLFDLEQEVIAVTPPGQPQSDESVERARKFAVHAADIAKLKETRLGAAAPKSKPRARPTRPGKTRS